MKHILAAAALAALTLPAVAQDAAFPIAIEDPYARASGPAARAGAAFMTLVNRSETDDRLIAAASDVAERVELHTHLEDTGGLMRMVEVEDGFAVPSGDAHSLARGGDHVMLMGLRQPFEQGATITLTLTFETAGEITVEVPVDNERMDMPGHGG